MFVIPLNRLGVDIGILTKAAGFTRGPVAGHKYTRREERGFDKKGRRRYRYYYDDATSLAEAKTLADGSDEEHEHVHVSALLEFFTNLAARLTPPSSVNENTIAKGFDGEVKVSLHPKFIERNHQPFVAKEKAGETYGRTPLTRIQKAIDMIPPRMKELLAKQLTSMDVMPYDTPDGIAARKMGAAAWAHPAGWMQFFTPPEAGQEKGGILTKPEGAAVFKSDLTRTEEVVWHECGHQVHWSLEKENPAAWAEWKRIFSSDPTYISAYAATAAVEDFAESLSCFISHPKQLAATSPARYAYMREHVFPEALSGEEVRSVSNDEMSWWKGKELSNVGKLASQMKEEEKLSYVDAYQSPKDQYYSIMYRGRQVYIRVGPKDKDEEREWAEIPDTVDPETGLPVYNRDVAMRFRAKENIKEIYDENGIAMSDQAAWLWMRQDDVKLLSKVKSDALVDYRATDQNKKTHSLAYQLYLALGESKGGTEKERNRVIEARTQDKTKTLDALKKKIAKLETKTSGIGEEDLESHLEEIEDLREQADAVEAAIKSGSDPARLERHQYVPSAMTREEFMNATPTFKFGAIRKAEEQPWQLFNFDQKTKKRIPRVARNPVTGKDEPVLGATVYSMANPDGTSTKIVVQESDPFRVGETILVPTEVKKKNGSTAIEWKPRELSKTQDPDPHKLAREFNTTVDALLRKNNRFMRGQINDPVLSQLINPSAFPIRNEGDLVQLMREAAKRGSAAWITVQGGDPDHPSNAHLKLRFDGGGNPIVEGDYWPRRFGLKPGARLDQIINAANTIKLDRIVEVKPRKIEVQIGAVVKYRDPKTGRIVFGRITDTTKTDKGLTYKLSLIKGQGTGMEKNPVVDSVIQVTDDLVPGKPNVRRRLVRPLKSDVLLYLDNVTYEGIDDKGKPYGKVTSGKIRIKLPSDGSFTADEIAGLPGIRTTVVPGTDEVELTINPRDLSVLREACGGFVMDQYVTDMLDQLGKTEKARVENDRIKEVVAPSQIVDDRGVVNVSGEGGLMKGCRQRTPNGKEFALGSHQVEALQFIAKRKGRAMIAHFMGTGKTVTAIAAIQMMKNLKDPGDPGKPAAGSPRKKVLVVVPLNTIDQWEAATSEFSTGAATVVGSSSLAGAVQAFKWPERKAGEAESSYATRVALERAKACAADPSIYNPDTDPNEIVVMPMEYFMRHEADLRASGKFDGLVVDEAHKVIGESEVSRAVERWNPSMNMFLMLTGTPVTNNLDTLPRIVDLLSNGKAPLGTKEDFKERYLVGSSVMLANGAKKPPKTDINPALAGELGSIMQQYLHVATTEDVKGKTMPAVMLDENQPAHMLGMQEKLYRASMGSLTEGDREKLEQSAALGLDEMQLLSEAARRKVNIARAFANSMGYKAPDDSPFVQYEEIERTLDKKGVIKEESKKVVFILPDIDKVLRGKPSGWDGKWPSMADVGNGVMTESYYGALNIVLTKYLGTDYSQLAGKKIDKVMLAQIRTGKVNGNDWGKVKNPEYGPEGAMCRGLIKENGDLVDLIAEHDGEHITVPVGTKFVRDPNQKAAGLYFHEDDWDFTGKVDTGVDGEDSDDDEKSVKGGQKPKAGMEGMSIQRSVHRRRERAMFDASMTQGSAKCEELERYINEKTDRVLGNPDAQIILFGNRIGSSCRTMEAKLRTMGYMDVNEALGADPQTSSDADKARIPSQGYFVTYFGKGATLGDRDINSEIYRKVKDRIGRDTATSMFVHRTMTGSSGQPPKVGEFKEGWSAAQRKKMGNLFAGPNGQSNIEIPMRVTTDENGRTLYVYESDIVAIKGDKKGGAKSGRQILAEIKDLEKQRNGAKIEDKAAFEAKLATIFAKHTTERQPLSQHQMDVFNNCKVMCASDAAQVGLNWGNATELVMYDSLHSPMLEWQRITRAARMLDDIVPAHSKASFEKIDKYIRAAEASGDLLSFANSHESALDIINEAIESLPQAEQAALVSNGMNPQVAMEAYFAQRTFEKINLVRGDVTTTLRTVGRKLDPVERKNPQTGAIELHERRIKPEEIVSSDVMNEIVENHLSQFERELLKSRKYLVNVKRLTTSVDMPEFAIVQSVDEDGNKTKKRIATGNFFTEVPSRAEQAQLTQGRAKQVPYEAFLKMVQNAHEFKSNYEFIANVGATTLSAFSNMPKTKQKAILAAMPADKAAALKEASIKKGEPVRARFYIEGWR